MQIVGDATTKVLDVLCARRVKWSHRVTISCSHVCGRDLCFAEPENRATQIIVAQFVYPAKSPKPGLFGGFGQIQGIVGEVVLVSGRCDWSPVFVLYAPNPRRRPVNSNGGWWSTVAPLLSRDETWQDNRFWNCDNLKFIVCSSLGSPVSGW